MITVHQNKAVAPIYREELYCCFSSGNVLLLTVTNNCNQYCQHCMRSSIPISGKTLNLEILQPALIEAISLIKPNRIVISGGEPMLVPNIEDLVSTIHNLKVCPSMCTNATTIDKSKALALKNAGLQRITVGIEGIGKIYDHFRNSPGGFNLAMQGINNCIDAGIFVTVNITLHDEIINSSVDFINTFADLNLRSISVTSPIIQGRLNQNEKRFTKITLNKIRKFANDIAQHVTFPVDLRIPRCNKTSCPSGKRVFSMDHLGKLSVCPDQGAINVSD